MEQLNTSLADFIAGLWDFRYVVAVDNRSFNNVIWIPTTDEITEPSEIARLANVLAGLRLARRQIPDFMADQIYNFSGCLRDRATGKPIDAGSFDIDELFNNDGSFRWLSDFLKFAKTPPAQRGQERIAPRLKAIHVAVSIGDKESLKLGLSKYLDQTGIYMTNEATTLDRLSPHG